MKNNILFKLSGFFRYILVLFLALSTSSFAQVQQSTPSGDQYTFSLKEAIDYALQHQSTVLNSRIDEQIADQRIRGTLGTGLPQVTGSGEFDDYVASPVIIFPGSIISALTGHPAPDAAVSFQKHYQTTLGINANQMIFDGTFLVGLQGAKTYASLSRKVEKSNEIDLVANVTKAFYGVKINETNLAALDSSIGLLQKSLDDTKAMYAQGFVEKLDVDRITVTLSNLQSQRQNLRSVVDLNYYLLKFQMGMPVNASLTLLGNIPSEFQAPVIETAEYDKRIEYAILKTNRDLDMINVRLNKSGYLPKLSAFGSLSTAALRDQFDVFDARGHWYPTGLIGLRLSVPIFDGFQKDASIKQANMALLQNQNDVNNFENTVDLQVKQASISYESSYKILQSQKANLALAEDVAKVTKIKYEDGVGTNLEVTDAESALIQAQNNYYNALYNLGIAHVDLQKAKGILY